MFIAKAFKIFLITISKQPIKLVAEMPTRFYFVTCEARAIGIIAVH